jgi:hypothetical protein
MIQKLYPIMYQRSEITNNTIGYILQKVYLLRGRMYLKLIGLVLQNKCKAWVQDITRQKVLWTIITKNHPWLIVYI